MVYPILHSQERCFQRRKTDSQDHAGVAQREDSDIKQIRRAWYHCWTQPYRAGYGNIL